MNVHKYFLELAEIKSSPLPHQARILSPAFHNLPNSRRRRQANKCTLLDRTRQRQRLRPGSIISTLDILKLLHQPDGRVASFRECELFCFESAFLVSQVGQEGKCMRTANADSWAPVERQIFPAGPQSLPSLRLEFFGVFAIEVFSAVHAPERPLDCLAFGDEDGGLAVRAAATGQDGVDFGAAGVTWDHWVKT